MTERPDFDLNCEAVVLKISYRLSGGTAVCARKEMVFSASTSGFIPYVGSLALLGLAICPLERIIFSFVRGAL